MITEATVCRICGGPFDPLLNLGTPVLSDFLAPDAPDPPSAPLDLVVCQTCETVQLRHTVDPDRLFRNYWYRSGINEAMRAELADVACTVRTYVPDGETCLDIGANDGTLLSEYGASEWCRIAVEPAQNVSPAAYADVTLADYFPRATAHIATGSVDAATSIATFYASPDPLAYVREIDRLLAPDGVWIVQMQDLGQMVGATAFDNICFEHLFYYSARTFANLLRQVDLGLVSVEPRAINGGSLRFVVRRRPHSISSGVLPEDYDHNVSRDALDHFAWRVGEYKAQLLGAIDRIQAQDLYLDLYAASTKSSTLLQYCGIDHRRLRCAVERTPEKWGLETSGTRIPIISEEDWRVDPAPCCLIGGWQFRDQFVQREAEYLSRGGCFLMPLPKVEVIVGQA